MACGWFYSRGVNWVHAALWGVAGGFVLEGLELWAALRRHGKWPWKVTGRGAKAGAVGYLIAELIRLTAGGILAAAAAASGQVSGPLAALAIGVAAPMMVERLTALIPLPPSESISPARKPVTAPTPPQVNAPWEGPERVLPTLKHPDAAVEGGD